MLGTGTCAYIFHLIVMEFVKETGGAMPQVHVFVSLQCYIAVDLGF